MFFFRKTPLAEAFNGKVDIHNHLLPGIDDGAPNIKTSIELLKSYDELGIHKIIATPHTLGKKHPNTKESIANAHDILSKSLEQNQLGHINLKFASEYMIDEDFEPFLKTPENLLTFADKYILIEMSYLGKSQNFETVLFELQSQGYQPILAHPERYLYLKDDYENYLNNGVKFQLNALATVGYYGAKVKENALHLLDKEYYTFIGTDIHHQRHVEAFKKGKVSKKVFNKIMALSENNQKLW